MKEVEEMVDDQHVWVVNPVMILDGELARNYLDLLVVIVALAYQNRD